LRRPTTRGRPWASPVYFAVAAYREFFWVSDPEVTHSRNLAVRPELGIVIFDSTVPINTGQGVYLSAVAEQLTGADRDRGIEIFSTRSLAHGADTWTLADIEPPAVLASTAPWRPSAPSIAGAACARWWTPRSPEWRRHIAVTSVAWLCSLGILGLLARRTSTAAG
jgi:Pyridoxamine 5'-phosphate oxidase